MESMLQRYVVHEKTMNIPAHDQYLDDMQFVTVLDGRKGHGKAFRQLRDSVSGH